MRHGPLPLSLSLSRARRDAGRTEEQMHSSRRLDVLSTSLTLPRSGAQLAGEHRQACIRIHGSSRAIERKERREEEKKRVLVYREGGGGKTFFCVCCLLDPLPSLKPPGAAPSPSPSLSLSLYRAALIFINRFFFINCFFNFHQIGDNRKKYKSFLSPCFKPSS